MNRSLKLSILMALALGSAQASAVELGQPQIKSAIGQPLLVEIPVTQVSAADMTSLSARLASKDQFASAGISGGRPTMPLLFSVVESNGRKVIRITSTDAVSDPYLDLLVEVSTVKGSSVSEVPILLDPPGAVEAPTVSHAPVAQRAVAPAVTNTAASTPVVRPARPSGGESRRSSNTAEAAPTAQVKNGQYGPIASGQTLTSIARATAPQGVDVNQMMLALKSANPDAFYRDNINALKTGSVLRVPSRDDASAMAAAAAADAVHQQNNDWRNGVSHAPVAVADAATRANASTAPTSKSSTGDKLALVPASGDAQSTGGSGKGDSAASIHQALQRSQEQLTSLQQQSAELKSRLKDLEDLNGKNQRLLALKDNEIAELQQKLDAARKAAGMPAEAAPVVAATPVAASTTAAVAPSPTNASSSPKVAAAIASSSAAPAAASTAAAVNTPAVTTPIKRPVAKAAFKPVAPIQSDQPWYMQAWALIVGALIVIALLAFAFLSRRRKTAQTSTVAGASSSLADRFGTAGDASSLHDTDPDQEELLDQLAENPDDIGLHLELVSLYYTRRDVERFEAAAEAMHAHISEADQPEWQDVVHMGEDLAPGHPLFANGATGYNEYGHSADHDRFDISSFDDIEPTVDSPAAHAPPPLPSKVSEYHYDFNLTPAQGSKGPLADTPPVIVENEPTSTWNFDEPAESTHAPSGEHEFGDMHDDPSDTKLDLARAYLDMGDPDGARAMLEEVLQDGNQMQKDVAKGLMAKLH